METDDEALALAAGLGDAQAFGLLIRRHYDRIFRIGWRLTGTQHDGEDLAHDIMAALPAKLRGFRGDAKFTTWLYRVILNAATDRNRKSQSHARACENWGQEQHRLSIEADERRSSQSWLNEAMNRLPGELRETVALVLGEDLTQKETAQILGLSEGTIAWRMSEVKRHLKDMAAKEMGDG